MKLPRTIGSLVSIEVLILSGCSKLEDVPRELHNMKSLRVLNLDETALYQSKSWVSWLSLKRSKELGFFWASLPCSLVKLSLESCRLSDDVMPNDLSSLPSLKCLNLSKNPLRSLPESMKTLTKLDELLLTSCTKLQVLPKLPIILSHFVEVQVLVFPKMVSLSTLACLFSSKRCVIFGCEKLIEVQDVFKLEPIENFEAEDIRSLFNMDSIDSSKVQLYNYLTDTKIVLTPQVLHECGITSTFIQGSEVPIWFEHRTTGPHIAFSFPTPSHPGEKICCFNLCIVFPPVSDQFFGYLPGLLISNETKEITRSYFSSFIGIPETNNNTMLWLIHWPTIGFDWEGDNFLNCRVMASDLNIIEFGITCGSENDIRYNSYSRHYYPAGNEEHVTRHVELELTQDLICNLGSCGNLKVQIDNHLEKSNTVASPKVLYDCGIVTEFDQSEVILFNYYRTCVPRPKISFTVPPSSGKIRWLKSSIILYAINDRTLDFFPRVEIVNQTKGTKWSYAKHFVGIPETKNTVIKWLSSWKFGEELEVGDRVNVTVLSDLSLIKSDIDLVYDYEPVDQDNLVDQYLQDMTRCSGQFVGTYVYHMFKSHRTLYRMSLVKK